MPADQPQYLDLSATLVAHAGLSEQPVPVPTTTAPPEPRIRVLIPGTFKGPEEYQLRPPPSHNPDDCDPPCP